MTPRGMMLGAASLWLSYSTSLARPLLGPSLSAAAVPPTSCVIEHCPLQAAACAADNACRSALDCNAGCENETNAEACNLLCELQFGYKSTQYRGLMQCMADGGCLPVLPPDGTCLADDSDAVQSLTEVSQVAGQWFIVRRLNCGQPGWPAGFDAFPCQSDTFELGEADGTWVDRIAYCGGTNSTCSTEMVQTLATVSIPSPGVLQHVYVDAPLLPQNEAWRVLSFPHPDWMLYVYCGYTPTGEYAGGSVVARVPQDQATWLSIPPEVEREFADVARRFGFEYSGMCVSDDRQCEAPPPPSRSPGRDSGPHILRGG